MAQQIAQQNASLRDVLRAQTSEAHERLHEHSSFVALFNQTLDLEAYCALMQRFYGFYVPLERAIVAALGPQPAYHYAPRAHLIAQDLVDLGLEPDMIKRAPTCRALASIVTPQSLGGVLYVIEGSTLGASPIDRAAQRLLDADTPHGRRFWAWNRAQNKQRWHLTNQYLDHLHQSDAPTQPLADGARKTFEALGDWLAPLDVPAPLLESRTA